MDYYLVFKNKLMSEWMIESKYLVFPDPGVRRAERGIHS